MAPILYLNFTEEYYLISDHFFIPSFFTFENTFQFYFESIRSILSIKRQDSSSESLEFRYSLWSFLKKKKKFLW